MIMLSSLGIFYLDNKMQCEKCGNQNQDELDLHHIVPRFIGGIDMDGRIYLCSPDKGQDCHRRFHKSINKSLIIIFKQFTEEWLKKDGKRGVNK